MHALTTGRQCYYYWWQISLWVISSAFAKQCQNGFGCFYELYNPG